MDGLFQKITEECKKTGFLETVLEKAHYEPEDRELLWSVLDQALGRTTDKAGWSAKPVCTGDADCKEKAVGDFDAGAQEVVMTLGAGVDELQEAYLEEGKLTEAYMVEVLGSEILLLAYTNYNTFVAENTDAVVKRYYFLGTGENVVLKIGEDAQALDLRLEALPGMLERSGLPVTCTEGYCMLPKKSVAFYAELTKDKAVSCEGICMGCGREDCPNRMAVGNHTQGNRTLDRPLTYGYARILGLFS